MSIHSLLRAAHFVWASLVPLHSKIGSIAAFVVDVLLLQHMLVRTDASEAQNVVVSEIVLDAVDLVHRGAIKSLNRSLCRYKVTWTQANLKFL